MKRFMKKIATLIVSAVFLSPFAAIPAQASNAATNLGALAVLAQIINYRNAHYYKYAKPAGEIEKKYTPMGAEKVKKAEYPAKDTVWKKYEVWYPEKMEKTEKQYPLVIMANGTGTKASQYKEVFKHLASWDFIVAGNEDDNSRTGLSSAKTLDKMLELNADANSPFYQKIDTNHIGIAGHSQGGVGAVNAVTNQNNGHYYKAVFSASMTSPFWGLDGELGPEWSYDLTKMTAPIFFVAGTGAWDSGSATDITATQGQGICPLWAMNENFQTVPAGVPKVMAREKDKDHGDMLRYADGYMTAWFMYWLKGDQEAGNAFFGPNAEIIYNRNWQDVRTEQ